MEAFFKTHKYLVEHLHAPVRRGLMDEIDWNDRLIGIKGSRGVGKTTFLLYYAREHFGADNKECLYINLNHFYFTERTLVDFASEVRAKGGKVLLIDQVFKYSGWSKELRYCYDNFEDLKIIFSGSSVMRLKEENPDLSGKVVSYNLRGFSFREFLNLMSGNSFPMRLTFSGPWQLGVANRPVNRPCPSTSGSVPATIVMPWRLAHGAIHWGMLAEMMAMVWPADWCSCSRFMVEWRSIWSIFSLAYRSP